MARSRVSRCVAVGFVIGLLAGASARAQTPPPAVSPELIRQAEDACRALQQTDPQKAGELCPRLPSAPAPESSAQSVPLPAPTAQHGLPDPAVPEPLLPDAATTAGPSDLEQFFRSQPEPTGEPTATAIPESAHEPLTQFGYDIFDRAAAGFAAQLDVPVTPDYIVGPGDEFTMTLWGLVDGLYKVQVDRNGEITLPRAGVIPVAGLRYEELRPFLERHLAKYYTDFHLSVGMGRLRSIRVYVVGEVNRPGGYTLSSLSTALNALFVASGPTKRGSLRSLQVIRGGKTASRIDLYDFLLKGDRTQDIKLQHEDTVLVPLIGTTVGVSGHVVRPAIYELKGAAALADALRLAGGPLPTADLSRVHVERVVAHEKRIVVDVDLSRVDKAAEFPIQNMDVVRLAPINPIQRHVVRLRGHVVRSGEYEFRPGMRVRDVIARYDQLLPEPSLDYSEIIRYEYPTMTRTVISFSIEQMMAGNPRHNLELRDRDELRVYPASRFHGPRVVTITGAVRHPGHYQLYEDMKVLVLIRQAGDPTEEAFVSRAEIRRKTPKEDAAFERTILYFRLDRLLEGEESENTVLQPDDEVVVYTKSDAKALPQVAVRGEVKKPGVYPLLKGMRVRDLMFEGGFTHESALREAELVRVSATGIDGQVVRNVIPLDPDRVLADDPEQNFVLQGDDELLIKQVGELKRQYRVTIQGEVPYPGTYVMQPGERLSSLIRRAGGFTGKAYLRGAVFTRESVRESQERQLREFTASHAQRITAEAASLAMGGLSKDEAEAARFELATRQDAVKMLASETSLGRVVIQLAEPAELEGTPNDLLLEDGDHLVVPPPPSSVSIIGSVRNPTAVMAQEGRSINDYVALAGGFLPNADRKAVYVVKADGSSVSPHEIKAIEAGDAILVPPEMEAKYRPLPLWRDIATIVGQFGIAIAALVVIF